MEMFRNNTIILICFLATNIEHLQQDGWIGDSDAS